jgi:hypothetical protein
MDYNFIDATECKADYRGSLVNLQPGTQYEIVLTLENTSTTTSVQNKTWDEEFPVDRVIKVDSRNTRLNIYDDMSGTPEGYTLIDGMDCVIDTENNSEHGIRLYASYVILRGFTIKNVKQHGIRINGGKHIVIEDCDISKWGTPDDSGFGTNHDAGISSRYGGLEGVVVQRCRVHHPTTNSNSWAEKHGSSNHPSGPQGLEFWDSAGNHVIRYNEFFSDKDHYFNDIVGAGGNQSYRGFPGADSDIYCNYLANSWDDGLEVEGGGQNVRVWNNYIEHVYLPIGNAPVSVGPLYVWRNISGRCYSPEGSTYGDHSGFLKMGFAGSQDWMTGHMYIFNNTIFQPDGKGAAGLGKDKRIIKHCVSRNNILHVRPEDSHSIAINASHEDNDFDYDLFSAQYPDNQENHGVEGIPEYVPGAGFDFDSMTGNFQLKPTSKGYNEGIVIPNFCDVFHSDAPDMGAHEAGLDKMKFGIEAEFIPQELITNVSSQKQVPNGTEGLTGIENDEFSLFPNPTSGEITISVNSTNSPVTLLLCNLQGQLISTILNNQNLAKGNTIKINLRNKVVSPGIYLLRLTNKNNSFTRKVILN